MAQQIAHLALVVRDYDEAIAYYTGKLGFALVEDTPLGGGKRWVVISPARRRRHLAPPRPGRDRPSSRPASATRPAAACSSSSTPTTSGATTHAPRAQDVKFVEEPRDEEYGTVVVFEDLYGNAGTWCSGALADWFDRLRP